MSDESQLIDKRAAAFLASSRNETDIERHEREAWLAADPLHLRAYRRLQELDDQATAVLEAPELREAYRRDLEAMRQLRRQRRRWLLFVVALVLAALAYAFQKGVLT